LIRTGVQLKDGWPELSATIDKQSAARAHPLANSGREGWGTPALRKIRATTGELLVLGASGRMGLLDMNFGDRLEGVGGLI
jgi:hypothetical protein